MGFGVEEGDDLFLFGVWWDTNVDILPEEDVEKQLKIMKKKLDNSTKKFKILKLILMFWLADFIGITSILQYLLLTTTHNNCASVTVIMWSAAQLTLS